MPSKNLQKTLEELLGAKLEIGVDDILSTAEQVDIGIESIRRKAEAEGWPASLLASRLEEQVNRIITQAKEAFAGVAHSGGVLGNMYAQSGGDFEKVLVWQAILDARTCPDCEKLHGTEHTLSDWVEIGIPGSGYTVCGGYCRCHLVDAGIATDEPLTIPRNESV